jgi:peptide/nickel transport system permease protein
MSTPVGAPEAVAGGLRRRAPRGSGGTISRAWKLPQTRWGVAITGGVLLLALLGPLLAPHDPSAFVAIPLSGPSGDAPLGADVLGRDVLSRVLHGGLTVVVYATATTMLGVGLGALIGMRLAFARRITDDVAMAVNDVVLAFPQLVLVLVSVAIAGPRPWLIITVVALTHMPRVIRVARSVTLDVRRKEYVEYAALAGIPRRRILVEEVLPNVATPLLVEFGLRLTWSIAIVAGISFLGYGVQPPQADWGLMINENRAGLQTQVWSELAPILCILTFTVGTNLLTEGLSRSVARVEARKRRR